MRRRQFYALSAAPSGAVSVSEPPQPAVDVIAAMAGDEYDIGGSTIDKHQCPKCLRIFKRGLHLHTRACKA